MTPRPTIVLFDIDGTLVHTGGAGRRALSRMFAAVFDVENAFEGYPFSGRTDPRIIKDAFARWFDRIPTGKEEDAAREAYVRLLEEDLDQTRKQVRVLPGVVELLDELAGHGALTGLATGNMEPGARLKLEVVGLWHRFGFGGFGSDAEHRGELTALGIGRGRALAGGEVPDERVFVVGDSPLDVEAAHFADAVSVAVMTGWNTRAEMVAAGPEFLFDDLSDTDRVLQAMGLERLNRVDVGA